MNPTSPQPRPNNGASPPDVMIVVPTRNMVLYPEMVLPLTVGRPSTVAAVQQAVREQRQIVLLLQRDAENNDPKPTDLYRVGTVANILRYMTSPEGGHHLVVQGVQRFRVTDFIEGQPFLVARGVHVAEPTATSPELEARFMVLKDQVRQVFDLLPQVPAEFRQTVEAATSPSLLADLAAT
jgi:ATP-dependent Lon protease